MEKSGPPQPGFIPPGGSSPPPPYAGGPSPLPPQQNVIIVTSEAYGSEPRVMTCPHCRQNISTRIDTESNTKTHLFALLLCLVGCWPCVCIPYCMDTCLVKKHYCPSCGVFLGESSN
ncbi:lipopolysaccharide-induced tumor necrosis factor-alpha factor homolog [Polistes fuscatus]|uniref:lipopolysaccharide-induced tumor necrosis factor-alpha factor homolog n=1 Tax=Polistes fuscatus TaxID=30207 RepID=UPI001CAA1E13|nr:lipopolysaccharide-induced tumor necrosis factor-alpha factor homolog [Polistes fuscatus]